MRVIVDENITHSVIQGLRDRGYDVLSVKESMRGVDDTAILQRAEAEQRLVVTQDKDFGELLLLWQEVCVASHMWARIREPSRHQGMRTCA